MAFDYRGGVLCAEQASLDDIARRFGTPCYVYSRAAIVAAYAEFAQALNGRDAVVCYSVKANSNLAILALLDDLQKHLFFLVLNPAGDVNWAYPVTAEKTPHRLRFSSGELTYAA